MGDVAVQPELVEVKARAVDDGLPPADWRSLRPEVGVAAVAAVVYCWGIATPGPWRDEAATLVICRRPLSAIVAMAHDLDLVHLAYYVVAHTVLLVADSLTALRLLSVLAMVAVAVVLVRIGRRLGSWRVGTLAAAFLIVSPMASRFAQEARPSALATLAGVAATSALLAAVDEPAHRRLWVRYSVSVVVMTVVSVLTLLLLGVHAVWVLLVGGRSAARRWAAAVVAAAVAVAPFVIATKRQQGQVSWLWRPTPQELVWFFSDQVGARWVLPVVALGIAVALATTRRLPRGVVLGVVWAVLPPLVLWAVSQKHTFWQPRYLLPALPGTALTLAWALEMLVHAVGRRSRRIRLAAAGALPVLAVTGLMVLSWPSQEAVRGALGHTEDVVAVTNYLQRWSQPGDAVVYLPGDLRLVAAFATAPARLPSDITLDPRAPHPGRIVGSELPDEKVWQQLLTRRRVWVVHMGVIARGRFEGSALVAKSALVTEYRRTSSARPGNLDVDLYERR